MHFGVHQDLLRALNLILPFSWRQTIQSTFVKDHMYIISIMFLLNNSKNIRKYAIWIAGCCEGSAAGNKAWNEHLCWCCVIIRKWQISPFFFIFLIQMCFDSNFITLVRNNTIYFKLASFCSIISRNFFSLNFDN